ncbi:aspartate aminotransferase family protein [Hoyosella sp. G463]|uniref:Aspartate aminotransferase family protein n=1 Tax=Lolliginicoccus lacisalsi TaxID=2742202 RepID=A0A927PLQ8_9ACTN|nr:aspartate aminotransferase family protein [Lolliginicoccus lacisalsi]MBD8507108.1 aspartate aminotransferase family protein [Lolliginicoccus lacisalsi]
MDDQQDVSRRTAEEQVPGFGSVEEARSSASRAYELDRKHVFHSWVAQGAFKPMVVTAAQGSHVWDGNGDRLLDFSSQLVNTNIGHQHPRVVAGIVEQAQRLATIAPHHVNDQRSEAARLIAERTPGDLDKVFFTNSGAEAVEHAIRMARVHTGRNKILSRYRSYHGATALAINVTGDPRRWANDRGTEGTTHFFGPFLYRSAFHATTEAEEEQRALQHLQQVIELEGPGTIAAIILETIPGGPGIIPPPPGYLRGVRELCDLHGIVMIADEVMCGFGRSGHWFAIDESGVAPDLLAFAKGVNSGYVPLGGVAISARVAETFEERPYPGGLTYSGHPLACAAAVATITAMADEGIVENARRIGETVLGPGLAEIAARHPCVGEARGRGVFWALELVTDATTREPLAPYAGTSAAMAEMMAECKRQGLLPLMVSNRIHCAPPCTITADEAREGLRILDEVLKIGDSYTV